MRDTLISIVVPVYNVKDYLIRCLESVTGIEYADKEIIVVDDGSTDGSGELCDVYAHSHPGVSVLHHEQNKGLIEARITGFNHSQGEYILFIDSDDYVHPQILQTMKVAADLHQADVVCCSFYWVNGDSFVKDERPICGVFDKKAIKQLASANLLYDDSLKKAGMPLFMWGKLYRRSLLAGSIQKSVGLYYYEDIVPVMDFLINKANKMVCLDAPLVYYVQHPSQITKKGFVVLCPYYLEVWRRLDALGCESLNVQLTKRIFSIIKPGIYGNIKDWGGVLCNNRFISTYKSVRSDDVVCKFLWNNNLLPASIKKHPHYILLKNKLYWLDYMMYALIWSIKKK